MRGEMRRKWSHIVRLLFYLSASTDPTSMVGFYRPRKLGSPPWGRSFCDAPLGGVPHTVVYLSGFTRVVDVKWQFSAKV
jgi:hypothetical protein